MLDRSHTAVLEKNVEITSELITEPYEVAWAGRARWFLNVLELAPGTKVKLTTEISPEGLTWCDHEAGTAEFSEGGMISVPVENIGPYMRLRISLDGDAPKIKAIIYLTLRQ